MAAKRVKPSTHRRASSSASSSVSSSVSSPAPKRATLRAAPQVGTQGGTQGEDPNIIERISLAPSANALRLLLRPEEAALALGISRATCYKLLARGDLPSILVGERLRRIPVAALNAYIATQSALQGVSMGAPGMAPGVSA